MAFLDNTGLTKLIQLIKGSLPTKATSSTLGLVKPDNSTITVDSDGTVAWGLSDRIMAGSSGNKSLVLCSDKKINASADEALSIAKGVASGIASIAHGFTTEASGQYSVATGKSKASGNYSHAENKSVAKGYGSHAEGQTTAGSNFQHTEGKFNIEDANGIFQHIVGAGIYASSPSTISAGDWNGNKYLAGNLYVGCNDFTTTANGLTTANAGGSKVATESYVDTAIANLPSGSSFSGSYNDLTDKPTLFSGSYNDLTNKPTLFSGSYNDLTNKPTLFSGDYNDLSNKPTIPSAYTLPTASTSTLGGVKVDGSTITISNDIISANVPSYTAGTGISISGTTIAVDRTLPPTVPTTDGYYVLQSVEGPSHRIWSWQSTVRSGLVSTETSPSMNNNINWVYG